MNQWDQLSPTGLGWRGLRFYLNWPGLGELGLGRKKKVFCFRLIHYLHIETAQCTCVKWSQGIRTQRVQQHVIQWSAVQIRPQSAGFTTAASRLSLSLPSLSHSLSHPAAIVFQLRWHKLSTFHNALSLITIVYWTGWVFCISIRLVWRRLTFLGRLRTLQVNNGPPSAGQHEWLQHFKLLVQAFFQPLKNSSNISTYRRTYAPIPIYLQQANIIQ